VKEEQMLTVLLSMDGVSSLARASGFAGGKRGSWQECKGTRPTFQSPPWRSISDGTLSGAVIHALSIFWG